MVASHYIAHQSRDRCDAVWNHSFSTYAKFSEKLLFLTISYQGVGNPSFSENFAHVLNE